MIREWLRNWLGVPDTTVTIAPEQPEPSAGMSPNALAYLIDDEGRRAHPFSARMQLPRGVHPKQPSDGVLAMDSASAMVPAQVAANTLWAAAGTFHEGVTFLGYQYLAELAQRAEYRTAVETIARDCTRKWIKLTGDDDEKVKELVKALEKFDVGPVYRRLLELDGYYGRGQVFIDIGAFEGPTLAQPLAYNPATIGKGKLKGFRTVEPMWTYAGDYESVNPLHPDFYRPRSWYVMSTEIHRDRLLTFVGREVPDILKPMYMFGGLSLTQMGKPYVDNWLRTRQSVSDLVHSFSIPVLKTNMSQVMTALGTALARAATGLRERLKVFNMLRDNRGVMAIDKDTEDFDSVTTPLSSLDKLQAQSQEHMASVWGIPLVVYLGVTPSGLNASSDGEITTYYDKIDAYNEKGRPILQVMIDVVQLTTFGAIDESITFDFVSLWEMDELERATIRKTEAETAQIYYTMGAISNEEERERLAEDPDGMYKGVDLSGDVPTPPDVAEAEAGREFAAEQSDADRDAAAQSAKSNAKDA